MERVMGIEPTPSAWKAEVLPLNYTRSSQKPLLKNPLNLLRTVATLQLASQFGVVEGVGFEPT
jgi:hypothetical protein